MFPVIHVVYISQLIRFARVCSHVTDCNARNKSFTAGLSISKTTKYLLKKYKFNSRAIDIKNYEIPSQN